jgi:hypothetical protein
MNQECEQMLVSIKKYCRNRKECDGCIFTYDGWCIFDGNPADWIVGSGVDTAGGNDTNE